MSASARLLDQVVADAAAACGEPLAAVLGPGRSARLCRPRFAAAWVVREAGLGGMVDAARALRRGCHSVAINAVARAEHLRAADPDFRELTDRLLAAHRRTPE